MKAFKVGDVIISKYGSKEYQVLAIGKDKYFLFCNERKEEFVNSKSYIKKNFDIKPKEVLITRKDFAFVWDKCSKVVNGKSSKESWMFEKLCEEIGLGLK